MKAHSRRGAAPLLWVFAVLAILFLLVERVIHSLEVEETIAEGNRLERLYEHGFQNVTQWAQWYLERDSRIEAENKEAFDSLTDVWNSGPEAPFWDEELPELLVRWRLVDAHSRLNLNLLVDDNGLVSNVNRQRLRRMMVELKLSDIDGLVASFSDWIDRDPNDLGESAVEAQAPEDSNAFEEGARNAPLSLLAELAMIPGYTQEVLWGDEEEAELGLAPWVTIHSDGKVNPNTAPPWVLMGVHENITRQMAKRIFEGRRIQPYKTLDEVKENSGAVVTAEGEESEFSFESVFSVISDYFILEMEADYNGRLSKQRVFLQREPNSRLVSVVYVERPGFFQWDEETRKTMKEAEEDLFESVQ